jgi:hypothetical protein
MKPRNDLYLSAALVALAHATFLAAVAYTPAPPLFLKPITIQGTNSTTATCGAEATTKTGSTQNASTESTQV